MFDMNIFNMNMGQKGNFIFIALGLMVAVVVLLPILMYAFPAIDIIVKIFLVFMIFQSVRGFLGNGTITLLISGILIYFLVIKWWWVGASGWLIISLFTFGAFSIITWGSKTVLDLTKPKM